MALPPPADGTAVVVTGAASGIGREVALRLAQLGYHLVLADVQDSVKETADEARGHGVDVEVFRLDLTDAVARQDFVRQVLDGPRAVVGVANVAGLISVGRFDELGLDRERILVDVSVSALHHLTGAFLPGMTERGAGAFLNVSSPAGVAPLPYLASYSAAKSFVIYCLDRAARGTAGERRLLHHLHSRNDEDAVGIRHRGVEVPAGLGLAAAGLPRGEGDRRTGGGRHAAR
ncbi:SDR family NAD(P)-dependent oxidoreductase [Nocardia sp. NPDC051756]|uniref:SDR family NAD(P)-dependent oxidoreductase n=1 Tax=Nocardia sp. NPDC051756 TaxID=3154751 RepID=UPI003443FF51